MRNERIGPDKSEIAVTRRSTGTSSQESYREETEVEANLSIRVPIRLRRHWVAEAKREGTTLTAVITEALSRRFGQPRRADTDKG